jgi:dihydroxyacetone kinase-like predicted kinase
MEAGESEIITLYRGQPTSMEAAEALEAELRDCYPEQEIELADGGQPHYHYIFSVE